MGRDETHRDATLRADAAEARAEAATDRARTSEDRADHLVAALDNRDVIGMAKGVLMHAEGIGPDEAFEVLVRASQHQNRKLHSIAAEIVSRYTDAAP